MKKKNNAPAGTATDSTVEVLYQKMGNRWFAFSLVDDEVFVGSITQEDIDHLEKNPQVAAQKPPKGNA